MGTEHLLYYNIKLYQFQVGGVQNIFTILKVISINNFIRIVFYNRLLFHKLMEVKRNCC